MIEQMENNQQFSGNYKILILNKWFLRNLYVFCCREAISGIQGILKELRNNINDNSEKATGTMGMNGEHKFIYRNALNFSGGQFQSYWISYLLENCISRSQCQF